MLKLRNKKVKDILEIYKIDFKKYPEAEKELFLIEIKRRVIYYDSLSFKNSYVKGYEEKLRAILKTHGKKIGKKIYFDKITICDACGEFPPMDGTRICSGCSSYNPDFKY